MFLFFPQSWCVFMIFVYVLLLYTLISLSVLCRVGDYVYTCVINKVVH